MKKLLNCTVGIIITVWFIWNCYGDTKYAGEFLNIGGGVRALGMGSAFTGISDDASASYWNPAGLGQLEKGELSLMWSDWTGSDSGGSVNILKYGFLSGVTHKMEIPYIYGVPFLVPFKTGSFKIPGHFGFSLIALSVPDIQDTRPETTGVFLKDDGSNLDQVIANAKTATDQETALYLSYCLPNNILVNGLNIGLSFKMINQKIFEYSSNGFGVDMGILYTGLKSKGLRIGLNLQDLTNTPIKWSTGTTDKIPLSIKLGLVYSVKLPLTTGTNIGIDYDTKYGKNMYFGTEFWFAHIIALRFGYKQLGGPDTNINNLTAGLGFILLNKYNFDYAFLSHEELGNTHRVSFSIKF